MPITSIDIWQAINSTPFSKAWRRIDSNESTPFLLIKKRIIRLPNPPIFILESLSFKESEGSINPNILPKISFLTFGFISFFITFRPQNVKNKVTFPPVAAAPFANTNVAKALSKSSLNRIKVFPLGVLHTDWTSTSFFTFFSTTVENLPDASVWAISLCPVCLHHAALSLKKPGSEEINSTRSPGAISSILFFSLSIGPGHCNPHASTVKTPTGFCAFWLSISWITASGSHCGISGERECITAL